MSFKFTPVTKEWRLNNRCDKYPFKITNKNMVTIYAYKAHPDAIIPKIAYGETSACFDITCVETTTIPARGSAVVPNGLRLGIDESESYWMQIQLRSSKGFKYELIPHYGTIDCVPKGTKISTSEGDKNIEDIFNNDKTSKDVLSYNEESKEIENDIITDIWIVEDMELLEIETEDGNVIKLPLSKQVYTDKGWVYVKDLTLEDNILSLV